nr:TlpA family protein disulfide reductase [Deltaproteobacteria bacterium]
PPPAAASPSPDANAPATAAGPTWYRAVIRAPDGVEVAFFLGAPAAGAPGPATFKVGGHEVRSDATFDGKTLRIPLTVHQTAVEATVAEDGTLRGTFSTTWRAWGSSSIPLTATPVAAPTPEALATVPLEGPHVELGEPRTVWTVKMKESGTAKLVLQQRAPGDFEGMLYLDTGNINYVAGNARGDTLVLTGFDGTSGYRLDLVLAPDRKRASGAFIGGHKLDWREPLTATRGADFELAVTTKATRRGARIGLPPLPELAALEPGPLVVELAGSWCSTCRNAAPFLVELDREYRPRGLRMVTLLYEFTDDPAVDAKQVEAFKATYGVTWPVVAVAGSIEDLPDILPTGLAGVNPAGFPITLFLAADRSLSAIHTGFPAATATAEHARVTAAFRANIEKLLAPPKR